jgi:LmbE family N-acetylglucosaminyl deacetylase
MEPFRLSTLERFRLGLSGVSASESPFHVRRDQADGAGQIDGHALLDSQHYGQFRRLLGAKQPDAVFTHWPIDNHADHRSMYMLVYGVWQALGQKFALYYYEVSNGEDTVQFAPTTSWISPEPNRASASRATRTPANHRTGSMRCRRQ